MRFKTIRGRGWIVHFVRSCGRGAKVIEFCVAFAVIRILTDRAMQERAFRFQSDWLGNPRLQSLHIDLK